MARGFGDVFLGTEDKFKQLPTISGQQQGLQNQAIGGAGNLLQQLLSNRPDFAPLAQQARTQFQTQTVPTLAERFSALPGQGGQRSSAFQGALGSAAAGLSENLAAQNQLFNMQNRQQDLGLLNMLFGVGQQPGFENLFMPGKQGVLDFLGHGLGQGLGQIPALLLGGGASSGLGMLSSLFGGMGGGNQQQSQSPFQLSGGLGGYNPNLGFGQQNFAGSFGRGQYF